MNAEEVIAKALECGFMLSTTHGQVAPKLMPVSDAETLMKFWQEAHKAGMMAAEKIAEDYNSYDEECGDKAHDIRWCSHCENKNDGADVVAQKIRRAYANE